MEERGGLKGSTSHGVFFSEGPAPVGVEARGRIRVEISRQNSNLLEVKERLAAEARSRGANGVVSFVYGQQPHRGLKLLSLRWDSESWYGEGEAVVL